MDDQVFADLVAEMDAEPGGTPEEALSPAEPESLSLQQTEAVDTTQEPVVDDLADETAAEPQETVDWQQKAQELQQQLEAREAEQIVRKEAAEAKLREIALQEDERAALEFAESLKQVDPEWERQFLQHRYTLAQDRVQALEQAQKWERGITALTLAVEHMEPGKVHAIIEEARGLMQYQDHDQMRRALETRNQRVTETNKALEQARREIAELRLKLDAQSRPAVADAVDGGHSGAGGLSFEERWERADGMDEVMALIAEMPGRAR